VERHGQARRRHRARQQRDCDRQRQSRAREPGGSLETQVRRLAPAHAYQATAAIGVGYHLIQSERTQLDARAGVGARRAEFRFTDEKEGDQILRGSVEFERKLNDATRLFDRYLIESGPTNTFTQNVLGIEVKMAEALGLGLSWEIRRNTEVLPGTRNSDQVFTAGLVVGF
jgi:putative salt-induced outer membrane protein